MFSQHVCNIYLYTSGYTLHPKENKSLSHWGVPLEGLPLEKILFKTYHTRLSDSNIQQIFI